MILQRYIAREIHFTLAAVFLLLMVILVSHQLVRYLADAAAGEIPTDLLFTLLGLKMVGFAGLVLPLALFVAVVAGLGRLYRDHEMVVMAACGIGPFQVLWSVTRAALPVTVLLLILSLGVNPWAAEIKTRVLDSAKKRPALSGLQAGRFQEIHQGQAVFFVERIEPDGTLTNIFVHYQRPDATAPGVLAASHGSRELDDATGSQYLVLTEGHRYEGTPGTSEFRLMEYQRHGVLLPISRVEASNRKREAIATAALLTSDSPGDQAEWQWRLALPLSSLLLAMLAVPLSRTTPREGRYGRILGAILLYLIFSNLLAVARNWLERGLTPLSLGLWWVHGLLGLLTLVLLVRQLRYRMPAFAGTTEPTSTRPSEA